MADGTLGMFPRSSTSLCKRLNIDIQTSGHRSGEDSDTTLTQDTGFANADFADASLVGINTFVSSRAVMKEDPHQPTPSYPLSRTQPPQQSDEEEELNILVSHRKYLLPH